MAKRRVWTGCIAAIALAVAFGIATVGASAQSSTTANAPPAAEPSAAPAEQTRRRDRRRPEQAATAAAAPAATAEATASEEPKLVCKNIKPIGSRVARRICATEEQWAVDNARTSADAAESMRQVRDRSGVTGGSSSGPASLGSPSFGQ